MNPKFYLVGGAVRDKVLGIEPKDKDYVVVGATPEWMLEQGYRQVGASFPVYLHPTTGEEYALARQERKSGVGYHGFDVKYDPTVTLVEDLERRDLTINSMAMDENGNFIDPFGGMVDLQIMQWLHHTSAAFADDPLRVLRVARFAARFPDFSVSPETMELMKKICASGELNSIPNERIWAELEKGLKEADPIKMIKILVECGATVYSKALAFLFFGAVSVEELSLEFEEKILQLAPDLSFEEKFLVMVPSVSSMDADLIRWLRIPPRLHKMALDLATIEGYLAIEEDIAEDDLLELIKYIRYDRNHDTEEMKSVVRVLLLEDAASDNDEYKDTDSKFKSNFERLNRAVEFIKKIDMKSELSGVPSGAIKEHVEWLQLEAIRKSLQEE